MAHTRDTRPAPLCPVHGVPMLVRRTFGPFQYRYCTAAGCHQAARTVRRIPDHPAPPAPAPTDTPVAARPNVPPRGPRVDAPAAIGASHAPKPIVNRAIKNRLERLSPLGRYRPTSQRAANAPNDSKRGFTDPDRPSEEDTSTRGTQADPPLDSPNRPPGP